MIRPVSILSALIIALGVAIGTLSAPQPAFAQSVLNGDWRGQASGNVVRVREEGGGLYVAAVTANAGQSEPLYFVRTGAGEYRYTFPDGNQAVVYASGSSMRVVNPDGWSDTFLPVNPPPRPAAVPTAVRTTGWPMPVTSGIDTAFSNAISRADQASRDAMERALTGPRP